MASFKAFVISVLLLLIVINIYSAPAAASQEAADEEVAKNHNTTTEVAVDGNNEIQGRLFGRNAYKFIFKIIGKGIKHFTPSPGGSFNFPEYYRFLDRTYCSPTYCYPSMYVRNTCQCGSRFNPNYRGVNPCTYNRAYCCVGSNSRCTTCCLGAGTSVPRPNVYR